VSRVLPVAEFPVHEAEERPIRGVEHRLPLLWSSATVQSAKSANASTRMPATGA